MKRFLLSVITLFAAFQLFSLTRPASSFAACNPPSQYGYCGGTQTLCLGATMCCDSISECTAAVTPAPTGPWWNQTPAQFSARVNGAPDAEIFGERYTYAQINWILNSVNLMFNPTDGLDSKTQQDMINSIKTLLHSGKTPPPAYYASFGPSGLLVGSLAEMFAHPPASGKENINQTLAHFDLAQPVNAQGYGFTATNGIQTLWAASRNMAFLVIILLLIVAGFMIMFRVKINPQTVISIQLMIPRLIITLVAITFSYAIAGLAIDVVYLLLGFVISILSATGSITGGPVQVFNWFATPDYGKIVWFYILPLILLFAVGGLAALFFSRFGPIGIIFAKLGSIVVILNIVLIVFFGWLLLKIWWMMVKTYLMLMITIVIGPWQIMLGLLPSGDPKSSLGFNGWFRTIISQVSVFLVVPLMFMMNMFFWNGMWLQVNPLGGVNRGSGSFPSFPLLNSQGNVFSFVVGFAILALIPKIADMVRDAIKAPQFKYGTAFNEALGPLTFAATAGVGHYAPSALGAIEGRFGGAGNQFLRDIAAGAGSIQEWGRRNRKWS